MDPASPALPTSTLFRTARLGEEAAMRVVAALVATLVLGTSAYAQEALPFAGHAAPDFTARLADGSPFTLADASRSAPIVILHFWGVT
jgi:hypothetical protein